MQFMCTHSLGNGAVEILTSNFIHYQVIWPGPCFSTQKLLLEFDDGC